MPLLFLAVLCVSLLCVWSGIPGPSRVLCLRVKILSLRRLKKNWDTRLTPHPFVLSEGEVDMSGEAGVTSRGV